MSKLKRVLIRVNASRAIGLGHLMRMLGLYRELMQMGISVTLATNTEGFEISSRLGAHTEDKFRLSNLVKPSSLSDAKWTIGVAQNWEADLIVLDGYEFDYAYQTHIRKHGSCALVCIDDMSHLEQYNCDLIVNSSPAAEPGLYKNKTKNTQIHLGLSYVILREAFLNYRQCEQRLFADDAQDILISLGGSDEDNGSQIVLEALHELSNPNLKITLVVGALNPHLSELEDSASRISKNLLMPIRLVKDARNMPELMSKADLLVSAGGSTVWEAAYIGCPNIVIVTAENQRAGSQAFAAMGAVRNLGMLASLSKEEIGSKIASLMKSASDRRRLANIAQSKVDGKGAARIVTLMRELIN